MNIIKRRFSLDNIEFKRLIRPSIYTIIAIVFLIFSLQTFMSSPVEGVDMGDYILRSQIAMYSSMVLTVLISISYYFGYYFPEDSVKRGRYLFIASLLIIVDAIFWMITGFMEIEIEGVGSIIIDTTPLLIVPIVLFSFHAFKKGFDLWDFRRQYFQKQRKKISSKRDLKKVQKNKIDYEIKSTESIVSSKTPTIKVKTKSDYEYYINEAKEFGKYSFNQVLQYFKNNHLSFEKKKLKSYFKKLHIQN